MSLRPPGWGSTANNAVPRLRAMAILINVDGCDLSLPVRQATILAEDLRLAAANGTTRDPVAVRLLADAIEQRLVGADESPVCVQRPAEYIAIADLAADGKVAGWDRDVVALYRIADEWVAEHC